MTDLEEKLRSTLARRADTVTTHSERVDPRIESVEKSNSPRWLYAAVAASIAGLAVGLAVVTTQRTDRSVGPADTASAPTPLDPTLPGTTLEAPTTTENPASEVLEAASILWLPAALPAGYELREITLRDNTDNLVAFGDRTSPLWVQGSPTGEVAAIIEILVQRPPETSDTGQPNATVHGLPAFRRDRPGGTTIEWTEQEQLITFETTGLDASDALAAAESVTVSEDGAELADGVQGFERIDPATGEPPVNPLIEFITIERPGDPASRVNVSIQAATGGFTLDHRALIETRRGTSNGVDYSISASFDGKRDLITAVQDGHVVTLDVASPVSVDVLDTILPLRQVESDDISNARDEITRHASELAELDTTELEDGAIATVRQDETSIALCVGITPSCRFDTNIGGAQPTAEVPLLEAFEVDGRNLVVGWAPTRPAVEPDDAQLIQGKTGWFILAAQNTDTDTDITIRYLDGTAISVAIPYEE